MEVCDTAIRNRASVGDASLNKDDNTADGNIPDDKHSHFRNNDKSA